ECGQRREGTRSVGGGSGKRREYLPGLTQGGGSLFVRPNYRAPARAGRPFPADGVGAQASSPVGATAVPAVASSSRAARSPHMRDASASALNAPDAAGFCRGRKRRSASLPRGLV